jgi:hypothetical protein
MISMLLDFIHRALLPTNSKRNHPNSEYYSIGNLPQVPPEAIISPPHQFDAEQTQN